MRYSRGWDTPSTILYVMADQRVKRRFLREVAQNIWLTIIISI